MKYKQNEFLKIRSKFKYSLFLLLYFSLLPLARIVYYRKNKWIICERRNEAQDNGYIFYKYLKDYHPEIKTAYIINKRCADAKKFSKSDNLIQFGSFKHFLAAIGSSVCISSQLFGYAPWIVLASYLRRNRSQSIHVFLQHGIIKNEHKGLHGDVCKSLDLFICGAKPEYDYISSMFDYTNGAPRYTGLARYDNLSLTSDIKQNNQILIMPTWRSELNTANLSDFKNSSFYREWNKLIHNDELINVCRAKKITIKLYLHSEFQKFSTLFQPSDVVRVVKYGEETVQRLLLESRMLITDFSSVYFDMAYMHKPIVFFQFDESTFYTAHYEKGYFDYRRDGFGCVYNNESDVAFTTKKYILNNFETEQKFIKRSDAFFPLRDKSNCKRIFEAIKCLK